MAVVKGPLFSLDASGSVAGAIVFSKWKGRNYVRQRVIPSNPKSGGQVGRRAMMRFLSQHWVDVTGADITSWQDLADALVASKFNAFVSEHMKNWHNFLAPSHAYPATRVGTPSDNILTAVAWEQNRIKITLAGSALGDNWGVIIFAALGAAVTPAVGNAVLVPEDITISAHSFYWTPHVGDVDAQWTFDSIAFSDDGVKATAGGPQSTS